VRFQRPLSALAVGLATVYALDRILKLIATDRFLQQPAPPPLATWPPVTMLHPVTRATEVRSALANNLRACARLDYPAPVRHLLICDAGDTESLGICRALLSAHPLLDGAIVTVPTTRGPVAPKIVKLQAGLAHEGGPRAGTGSPVLCFIDDDIAPRPDTLRHLIAALCGGDRPVGAAFGLPCYTNWRTTWSSLIGIFNNANFVLATAALTYLAEPPRITGHFVVYRRDTFVAAGGLDGLEDQIDDDFALARRLRAVGAALAQTSAIYDVDNDLANRTAFTRQLRRWFVLPRQAMARALTPREAGTGLLVSSGLLLPPAVAALALIARTRTAWGALALCLGLFSAIALLCERRFLQNPAPLPPHRWWLLPPVATLVPLQAAAALLSGTGEVEWRGQRLRIAPGGRFEQLP
jgi:ceramide glucosyltransferase